MTDIVNVSLAGSSMVKKHCAKLLVSSLRVPNTNRIYQDNTLAALGDIQHYQCT